MQYNGHVCIFKNIKFGCHTIRIKEYFGRLIVFNNRISLCVLCIIKIDNLAHNNNNKNSSMKGKIHKKKAKFPNIYKWHQNSV